MNDLISFCIPTIKSFQDISFLVKDLEDNISQNINYEIIYSCTSASASVNSNICLDKAKGEYIVMLDDDMTGFYIDWFIPLIELLYNYDNIIISPRLINKKGEYAMMMGAPDIYTGIIESIDKQVLSACIVFRKTDLRFDENFIGSGYEDTDFMKMMNLKYPNKKILINNNVKIIHLNEMKNQKGEYWKHNKQYYIGKWGL